MTAHPEWIFPLGHYLGPFHSGRDTAAPYHQIRVGRETVRLFGTEELAAWTLAHGLPDGPAGGSWSRDGIVAAGREHAGVDLSEVLSDLLREGVLVEVGPGAVDAVGFAGAHRFCPLLLGIGAEPARPDQVWIGLTGRPVVAVDELGHQVWQWAHQYRDLWQATQAFAAVERQLDGATDGPEDLLGDVLHRVHRLLAHGAGYLDVAA